MKELENAIRTARALLDEASRTMRKGEGSRPTDIADLAHEILHEQGLATVFNAEDCSYDICINNRSKPSLVASN